MLLLVLAAAAAAGGALVRVVSLPEAAGRLILLLLLLDATTDLPPPLLLDVADADEAAVDAAAGVGVFFEKKENKFFCLEVAMVHCYILVAEIVISTTTTTKPKNDSDSRSEHEVEVVNEGVGDKRARQKMPREVGRNGGKEKSGTNWREVKAGRGDRRTPPLSNN